LSNERASGLLRNKNLLQQSVTVLLGRSILKWIISGKVGRWNKNEEKQLNVTWTACFCVDHRQQKCVRCHGRWQRRL